MIVKSIIYFYLRVWALMQHIYQVTKEAREAVRLSVAEVIGSCEPPDTGVGNRTEILSRRSKHS